MATTTAMARSRRNGRGRAPGRLPQALGGAMIVAGIAGASGAVSLVAERLGLSSARRGRGAGT